MLRRRDELERYGRALVGLSTTKKTSRGYQARVRSWRRFCRHYYDGEDKLVGARATTAAAVRYDERRLLSFLSHLLLDRKLLASTARGYVTAIWHWHTQVLGVQQPIPAVVRSALQAERRVAPPGERTRPLLARHLIGLYRHYKARGWTPRSRVFFAAQLVGWHGLLRPSGFLKVSDTKSRFKRIRRGDARMRLQGAQRGVRLRIPASKTNPRPRMRFIEFLPAPGGPIELCAATAVGHVLRVGRGAPMDAPLFPISDAQFTRELRRLIGTVEPGADARLFSTRSLRTGGATTLRDLGASGGTIQEAGRWTSDCYFKYLRDTDEALAGLATFMAGADGEGAPGRRSPRRNRSADTGGGAANAGAVRTRRRPCRTRSAARR